MPDYLVTDPATGQRIKMTGPAPPSEALIRLALSKVKPLPSHVGPEQNTPDFGGGPRWSEAAQANVGPNKGLGFLGPLKLPNGVMSELSEDGEINGMPVQYPLIVPTLNAGEVRSLMAGAKPTEAITRKAQQFAAQRIAAGKSPFAALGEQDLTIHPQIPRTSQTRDPLTALQGAQTIGPARVGERYQEDLNPSLVGIARKVLGGAQRPASVAAEDPYGIGAWLKGAGPMPTPIAAEIQAYHGSPHDFEKFLSEKIGTGEGAQAYGHGLYFAENPAVAEEYKRNLGKTVQAFGGEPVKTSAESMAHDILSRIPRGADKDATLQRALRTVDEWGDAGVFKGKNEGQAMLDVKRAISANFDKPLDTALQGKTYHVSIKADPDQFLDWDKPLSQQPPKVQEAIKSLAGDAPEVHEALPHATGEAIYRRLLPTTRDFGSRDQDQITEAMRQAGIPGIKYLDQGSRGMPEWRVTWKDRVPTRFDTEEQAKAFLAENQAKGRPVVGVEHAPNTSNYVVFDDKLIDILKKYAVAGAVGGSLASLGQPPAEEQK
jgi:hypothetical protein